MVDEVIFYPEVNLLLRQAVGRAYMLAQYDDEKQFRDLREGENLNQNLLTYILFRLIDQ
jgi:hypothetical protein